MLPSDRCLVLCGIDTCPGDSLSDLTLWLGGDGGREGGGLLGRGLLGRGRGLWRGGRGRDAVSDEEKGFLDVTQ